MTEYSESDPRYHTQKVRGHLDALIEHMRKDVGKIDDPRAQALLETSAEVLGGLRKAFLHYETEAEEAWR